MCATQSSRAKRLIFQTINNLWTIANLFACSARRFFFFSPSGFFGREEVRPVETEPQRGSTSAFFHKTKTRKASSWWRRWWWWNAPAWLQLSLRSCLPWAVYRTFRAWCEKTLMRVSVFVVVWLWIIQINVFSPLFFSPSLSILILWIHHVRSIPRCIATQ